MSLRIARKALALASVPAALHPAAMACMAVAQERHAGLDWVKVKARLWYAKKLAKAAPWAAEHVEDYAPDFTRYGIAPNLGKGINGDNVPWVEVFRMPDGREREMPTFGKPRYSDLPEPLRGQAETVITERWGALIRAGGEWLRGAPTATAQELGTDPAELEHQTACARNYWGHRFFAGAKGMHPRHWRSRLAWLRSNGGEREAWSRGQVIPQDRTATLCWLGAKGRDTAAVNQLGTAVPMAGYPLRACVTWGCRPEKIE